MPAKVKRIHIGMSKAELEAVLGEADYSPTDGQYYFGTGGDCPFEDPDRKVPCGVVAEFRIITYGATIEIVHTDSLQGCWWGGIGE